MSCGLGCAGPGVWLAVAWPDRCAACRLSAHPAEWPPAPGSVVGTAAMASPRGDPEVVALERGPLAWSTGESGQQRKEIATHLEEVPGGRKAR